MTLVVGATGILGMEICRRLAAARRPFRALVRRTSDPARREELASLGAELVEGDLKDPASLQTACAGVRAIISTATSIVSRQEGDSLQTVDRDGQLALVDAAKAAHVDHFVFISFRDPQVQFPLTEAKRAVERRLAASGMAYTSLQASFFMEIWLTPIRGFDYLTGKVTIFGDGNNRISWVSYKDVARIAVAALDQPRARNTVLNVGGPQALSPREVVQIFEEAGVKISEQQYVPERQLHAQLHEASDAMQKTFAGLMLMYASGDEMDMTETLKLFPIPLTSVRDYVMGDVAAVRNV